MFSVVELPQPGAKGPRSDMMLLIRIITAVFLSRSRKLGLELVPRRGAEAVDPEDMSLVELYRVHVESAERAKAVRGFEDVNI